MRLPIAAQKCGCAREKGGNGPAFPSNGHLDLNADQVVLKVNILIGAFLH
jgi:hypothetical protein